MSKRVEISEESLEAIKKLVEYLEDADEEGDYEEWSHNNSESTKEHIWQSVVKVREMINKIDK